MFGLKLFKKEKNHDKTYLISVMDETMKFLNIDPKGSDYDIYTDIEDEN